MAGTDLILLTVALASFGVLLIGWMLLPTPAVEELPAPTGMPAPRTA
ncbi:MAG TPA: hypothetical protein VII06_33215 [Chloroflexota bacterium]|jgi:hypothetical protein